MIYFTSDHHFGDPRVLRIDKRPFRSVAEHDFALIRYWNETVSSSDTVWHLGDFARADTQRVKELLSSLNGTKHLVIGNNDGRETLSAEGWTSIQHYVELVIAEQLLILCHFPFRTWNQMSNKSINLHGHSHGRLTPIPRQFDVGVDAQSFRPVTLEQILARKRRRA